ncbi:Outer membrane protein beta-barrel domain-containing protein [Salinimicrobium catena]|uniref:Outer membrane protein beta-barrel domain-containing protein n=1 Tax=Salinimicrobium catena TaxID=390640 RepID=A0A1H5P819_9FLAO|nr:porin family protein [Salinimicrobium catena]SDL74837.1 Outer membrane protein beta-barrel domain-containing protein [Salinimicrobium catena]SEF10132.1 Outer membrane protein beta-barrel domain-containing protein [Salinimicrobium catena]
MKKLLLVAAFFFAVSASQAQEMGFGIKGGVNFANLSGDDVDDIDGRTGFHLGLLAEFGLTESFSIQPEVLYSAQGAKDDEMNWNLDYLTIPVMAKYYAVPGFSIEAGPYVGFNVKSEVEMDGVSVDVEDETESTDFGVGFGLGYELPMGVFFQARYNMGLSDIASDADAKNSVFQLSVGYKLF